MEFKVLNKATENKLDPQLQKALITIDVGQKGFFLNRYACEKLEIWIGDHIDFLILQKNYMIAKSKAPNGYKLVKGQKSRTTGEYITTRIMAAAAVRILRDHYHMKENRRSFYLVQTEHEYKGNPVFEMLKTH